MNMKTSSAVALLLVFIFTLATSVLARPPIPSYDSEEYTDNNIVDSIPIEEHDDDMFKYVKAERNEYVEISEMPKKDIYYPDEPIEAECRVSGYPVPTVEWVHGTGSRNNDDFETNTIMERSPSGIATVVAKLIVRPQHIPQNGAKRTFTCVGKSGGKIAKASTTVHFNHHSGSHLDSNDMIKVLTGSDKVQIFEYYDSLFDNIGSTVFLPCKATNNAEIYWINTKEQVIKGQDSRFKVLSNGELMITNLQFQDMGTYICLAKDGKTKDVASTFVYALKRSHSKE
ncbi:neural/ectodermal development factor IMP-L2 [Chironomus tepperi]|uniref:neural/ectodermal development factor IMP-L2 n=1 Tax=Chironomus tepperi TaxID=113505 RepID=UPI00391F3D86